MDNIILASSSPRRQELLRQLGIPFRIQVASVDETVEGDMPPGQLVETLSLRKARAVSGGLESGLVIGSDTVVTMGDKILGKPVNKEDALEMLESLRGRRHQVFTGLAVIDSVTGKYATVHECTEVYFRDASRQELEAYISTGEPFDKAGAYGIQGMGAVFVSRIEGCYFNVMGLPVAKLVQVLQQFGVTVTGFWKKRPVHRCLCRRRRHQQKG